MEKKTIISQSTPYKGFLQDITPMAPTIARRDKNQNNICVVAIYFFLFSLTPTPLRGEGHDL